MGSPLQHTLIEKRHLAVNLVSVKCHSGWCFLIVMVYIVVSVRGESLQHWCRELKKLKSFKNLCSSYDYGVGCKYPLSKYLGRLNLKESRLHSHWRKSNIKRRVSESCSKLTMLFDFGNFGLIEKVFALQRLHNNS